MKNFDIEQLERKNIYKTPENFFAGMQENVMKQTVHQKPIIEIAKPQGKVIPVKTNWIYAAAAALVMLLGFGFFIKNINSTPESTLTIAENINKIEAAGVEAPAIEESATPVLVGEIQNQAEKESPQDLTFEKTANPTAGTQIRNAEARAIASATEEPKARPAKAAKIKKEDVDQLLTSFTSSELAEMSKDAEMDVYLDLYN